ncbi:hypothetical protein CXB51_024711 [Gossypium anomalum]|uniref:Alcohol dehydrogenase n=1 Tax=Gossypium anomalum TaxID=47600 RepID=A0A8J6CPY2_9ROSI|nr:hypothetical protein CXB51_024711 [Gossypium anomalum]
MLYASVCHTDLLFANGFPIGGGEHWRGSDRTERRGPCDSDPCSRIDPKTPLPDATFLSCGFSTGYGAAWKEPMLQNASSVAVFGLGPNPMKEAKGQAFGMTDFINPKHSDKPIAELVKDLTGGMGVDYSLECTGVPPLINQAILSTKLGTGKIIQIGVTEESNVNINILELFFERTLKGLTFGGLKAKTDLPIIYEKCKNREIQLDELKSHEIKLEDANKVSELLKQPDCFEYQNKQGNSFICFRPWSLLPTMSSTNSHVITCKGIVSWGKGEPLKVEEIQVEPPKSYEVRVKMLYAGSIGEGVTGLREGDLVIPTYVAECRTCENCMSEKTNLCLKYPTSYNGLMLDGSSRMTIGGQTAYHAFSCSTWCQYMVINLNFLLKIDPKTPLPDATFLSCGFSTGYGAAWMEPLLQNASSVAVFGLGPVGLGNPMKEAKGKAFGMTDFINPEQSDKPIAELVKDLTGGMGVDYSLECTGVPPLINQAILSTKLGTGKIIQIGVPEEAKVNINISELLFGRTLKGSIFGGLKPKTDLPIIFEKCKNREIQLDELKSHEIKLEDANKVSELLKQLDCVKILINI